MFAISTNIWKVFSTDLWKREHSKHAFGGFLKNLKVIIQISSGKSSTKNFTKLPKKLLVWVRL